MATSDKIRILSKITSFTDVTKSLQEIEKVLNNLVETIKTPAEKELKETEKLFESLMGKKAEYRFKFIQENANFTNQIDI